MTPIPPLPQTDALAEASPESLSDLFSRDPTTYTPEDISRMVVKLREQRTRLEAQAAAKALPKPKAAAMTLASPMNIDELGL